MGVYVQELVTLVVDIAQSLNFGFTLAREPIDLLAHNIPDFPGAANRKLIFSVRVIQPNLMLAC